MYEKKDLIMVAVKIFITEHLMLSLSTLWLQEASASEVASAATLSVAFMEALSTFFQNFSHDYRY